MRYYPKQGPRPVVNLDKTLYYLQYSYLNQITKEYKGDL
jgi:hypothetical protein